MDEARRILLDLIEVLKKGSIAQKKPTTAIQQ